MSGQTGYAVGQFRDPEAEIQRLRDQASMVAQVEEDVFTELGFPETGDVLDVGCGPGFVAARLLSTRPGLCITGVDRDPQVLAEAGRRIPVVQADAASIPLADATFSAAYARVVLRHVSDPVAVVREMVRLVESGGVVLVADSDDGTLALDPVPDGFDRVLEARHASFRRRGADPTMGRRVFRLLHEAGLEDVQARSIVVGSHLLGPPAFAATVLSPLADAIDSDLMDPAEVAAAAAAVRDWGRSSCAFGMMTAVVAAGRRRE